MYDKPKAMSTTTKKETKAKTADLEEVISFLETRFADGGATTHQLQNMLHRLKPDEYEVSPVANE